MATVSGILSTVLDLLKGLVPAGVEPIMFFATFLMTAILVFSIVSIIEFFKTNRALALVSAIIIGYLTASSAFVTIMVAKLFPNIGLAIMAILGVMLVFVFLAPNKFKGKGLGISPLIGVLILIAVVCLTWVFAAPALQQSGILAQISGTTGFAISNEDIAIVVIAIVVIGGLYMIFKGPDKGLGGILKLSQE